MCFLYFFKDFLFALSWEENLKSVGGWGTGPNSFKGTVTWDGERSSKAAMGGKGRPVLLDAGAPEHS